MGVNGRHVSLVVATLLTVSFVAATPGLVFGTLVPAPADGSVGIAAANHGSQANYTVMPADDDEGATNDNSQDPNGQPPETCIPTEEAPTADRGNEGGEWNCDPYNSHMPGDGNASFRQFAYAGEVYDKDMREAWYTLHVDISKKFNFYACDPIDANPAGLDRDNDDPGLQTDKDFVQNFQDTSKLKHRIWTEFVNDSAVRENLRINDEDQIVAEVEDCYTNPDDPGWYQWYGMTNGTRYAEPGNQGEYLESETYSHWFYICNCTTEQQAEETLGPKPEDAEVIHPVEDGGGGGTPTPTSAATPTPTPEGPTPTQPPGGTPTPTESQGPTPTPQGPTATQPPGGTATPTSTGTGPTATTQDGGGDGGTPTIGSGPGFGVLVALVALLGAALLTHRRRE